MPSFQFGEKKVPLPNVALVSPQMLGALGGGLDAASLQVIGLTTGSIHVAQGAVFNPPLPTDCPSFVVVSLVASNPAASAAASGPSSRSRAPAARGNSSREIERKKKENENLTMECQKSSDHLMSSARNIAKAPQACYLTAYIGLLSAGIKDVSLLNDATRGVTFKLLTTPRSLKASLYQVQVALCNAFREAANCMLAIETETGNVPYYITDVMELLALVGFCCIRQHFQDRNADDEQTLRLAIDGISETATACKKSAEDAHQAFKDTIALMDELKQAAVATDGFVVDDRQKKTAQLVEGRILLETMNRQLQEEEDRIKRQEAIVKNVHKEYQNAMKDSRDMGGLFVAMMADTLVGAIGTITGAVGEWAKAPRNLTGTAADHLLQGGTPTSAAATVLKTASKENQVRLLEELSEHLLNPEELQSSLADDIASLKTSMKFSGEAAASAELATKTLKLLQSLKETPPGQWSKAALEKHAKTIQNKNFQVAAPAAAAIVKATQKNLMQMKADGVKNTREMYDYEQRRLDASLDAAKQERRAIAKLTATLESTKIEELNLAQIIDFLKQALTQLGTVRIIFYNISQFFSEMENIVTHSLTPTLTYVAKNAKVEANRRMSDGAYRAVSRSAVKACCLSHQVGHAAALYVKISDKHIMPVISEAGQYLVMKPQEAQQQLILLQQKNKNVEAEIDTMITKSFKEERKELLALTDDGSHSNKN